MKRRVIAHKNMPARVPLWQTVTMVLVMDRIGAPDLVWGVGMALAGVVWVALYAVHRGEEAVDVLATKDAPAAAAPFVTTESTVESRGIEWDVAIGGHA